MATRTSRLAGQFTESVIRRSTIWAREHGAVNLSQGFPEDDTLEILKARAVEAILAGRNQYSDTWGTAEFRDAVAIKMNRFYGLALTGAENVTVTCGAAEAMQASLLAVVDPGDEVILFEPSYENFRAQILIARGHPVPVPLTGTSTNSTATGWLTLSPTGPLQFSSTTRITPAAKYSRLTSWNSSRASAGTAA